LLVCWVGSAAEANAQSFELRWQAPDECPSEEAMRARITSMLANSEAASATVHATAHVSKHDQRWVLALEVELPGRRATRTLHAGDCASLSETAAWLVSVAVDPHLAPPAPTGQVRTPTPAAAVAPPASPAPEPPAAQVSPAKPAAVPVAGRTPATPPKAKKSAAQARAANTASSLSGPPVWRVGVLGGIFAGGLAGPSASAGAELGLEVAHLSFALSIAHDFERSRTLRTPGVSVGFSGQELGLAACLQWGGVLRAGPCALLTGLRTQGRTYGAVAARTEAYLWSTVGAGVALSYNVLAPLELTLDAGASAPVSARPRFEVPGLGTVGDTATVGARVRLGASLRLP
jgi:hypothetical protein